MLKLTNRIGADKLRLWSFIGFFIALFLSLVGAKVENSFQNSQYPQYKDYYASTPNYQYPDLTKTGGNGESSPVVGSAPVQQSQDSLLTQSSAQQPVVHGTPNQHVYYYETYPMQDTSRGNLYNQYSLPGHHGGNKRCTYTPNGEMRCYSRQDTYGVYGNNDYDTTGDDGGGAGGLAGLFGLLGLLGLKGLKGVLKILLPFLFFPVFLPFLLILALPLLLLLPIPVISVPAPAGRSLEIDFAEARKIATGAFERVISSDQCIERISCEISKMSQKRKAGGFVEKILNYLPENSPITKRIFKGFDMVNNATTSETEGKSTQQTTCAMLKCKVLSIFDSSQ